MVDQPLSKVLKRGAAVREWSRYRIAKESGVSEDVVNRFLNGDRDIRLETADKLVRALGERMHWMLHLEQMADRSPSFAVNCAWGAVSNGLRVALAHAPRPARGTRLGSSEELATYLASRGMITSEDSEKIRELGRISEAAAKSPDRITKREAIAFVVDAALIFDMLWNL